MNKNNQLIYKNGCWGCKKALEFEDWQSWNFDSNKDKYICPQSQQHLIEFKEKHGIDPSELKLDYEKKL